MLDRISKAKLVSKIENQICEIENVEGCILVWFNTFNPSVVVFFEETLNLKEREKILNQINKVMEEYDVSKILEVRHGKASFNIEYSR